MEPGFEVSDYLEVMQRVSEKNGNEDDVIQWLEVDADDPGYHHQTEEEIAESVADKKDEDDNSEDDEDEDSDVGHKNPYKLSKVREAMGIALLWLDYVDDREAQNFYTQLREV